MKNLNKVLALLVVFMMMLSTVAFASSFSDVADSSSYSTAIEVGVDLGLIKGYEDGTFKPEGEITRAEFAAIVVRLLGQEAQAEGAKAATQFTDVPASHWAAGYVNIAVQAGVINGYGNGMFGPEDLVEYQDAITMMVRALGYEPAIGAAGYPTGYLTKAGELGLTSNVNGTNGVASNRGTVAQIAFNALDVPLMTQSGYGTFTQYVINDGYSSTNGTYNVKKTLLSENHNIVKVQGTIESSSDSVSTNNNAKEYVTVDVINAYNNKYGTAIDGKMFAGDSDAMDYVGKKVILFVEYDEFTDEKTIKALYEVVATDTLVIDIADIVSIGDNEIKYYINDSKTTTVSLSDETAEYYNGYKDAREVSNDTLLDMSGTIELSLLDNETTDGDYDTMYITAYDVFVVDEVNATSKRVSSKIDTTFGTKIGYNEEDGDVKATLVDANGVAMDWADLEEYDVLSVKYVDTGAKEIYVASIISNTVTGTVTGLSGEIASDDRYVEIDGTEYKVLVVAEDEDEIKLGDEGTYYLDGSDNVVYHSATITRNNNYAYIISMEPATTMDNAKVKVLTVENGIVTVEVASKVSVTFEGEKTTNVSTKSDEFKAQAAGFLDQVVAYKLNASGQVSAIEIASEDNTDEDWLSLNKVDADLKEYDADGASFKVDGKKYYLTDNTVIFYVPEDGDPDDDYEVVALKNLSDDQDLYGADLYDVDDDRNIGVIVLKGENSINPSSENAAFVTKVSNTTDEDGYDVVRVTAYVGLDEVTYICEDVDADEILGKLVVPTYKANGDVKDFEVVGEDFATIDEDVEVAYGTLKVYNDGDEDVSPINTKKKLIVLNGDDAQEYKVPSTTNIYVYDNTAANSRNKAKIGESLGYIEIDAEDGKVYVDGDEADVEVTVYLYIYDGDVVDMLYYIDNAEA